MAAKKVKSKVKKIYEKDFQKSFMKALKFKGYLCYKQNTLSGELNGHYVQSGIPEGASDLVILVHPGIVVFCELKSSFGRQRESQKLFQKDVERLGGIYLLCSAADSMETNLNMVKMVVERKCEELANSYGFKLK